MKSQVVKGARISGCLYNLIRKNKFISPESKTRIYKSWNRPVITYGAEARADTVHTQQLLRTTEMRIVRTIHGETLRDRIYSKELRKLSEIKDIVEWVNYRRRYRAEHVERMSDDRLPKIVLNYRPGGYRSRGRPKKRWKESYDPEG